MPPAEETTVPISTSVGGGGEADPEPPGGGPTQISDEILNPLRARIQALTDGVQSLTWERIDLNSRRGMLLLEQTVLDPAITDERRGLPRISS